MTNPICDACETVSHCSRNGCIPITNESAIKWVPLTKPLPTFDEWHLVKHGHGWDAPQNNRPYDWVMRDLARQLRDYATDMAALSHSLLKGPTA